MTRVLVVEPDASARHTTVELVRRLAPVSVVASVASLDQVWHAIDRLAPELLIVDPAPYGARGELMLHLFRELFPAARVLVLTATGTSRRSVRRLPADMVAEKRLSPPQLRAIILAALDERKLAG